MVHVGPRTEGVLSTSKVHSSKVRRLSEIENEFDTSVEDIPQKLIVGKFV